MSASQRTPTSETIFTAQGADATSAVVVNVVDFKNIQLSLTSTGNANLTVKIKGSTQKTAPDFTSAAAVGNQWDYVAFYNYNGVGGLIAGATGYQFAGVDAFPNLLVNVDGINWLTCEVDNWVAGSVNVNTSSMTNQ